MVDVPLDDLSDPELLQLWSRLMAELHARGVVRSSNNPVGDYCELLVATHFRVEPEANSNLGHDLVTPAGTRVQVKGRRITARSPAVGHFSAIRKLEEREFDEVVAVVLNEDFSVREALRASWDAVNRQKRWNKRLEAWVLPYTQAMLADPDIKPFELNADTPNLGRS